MFFSLGVLEYVCVRGVMGVFCLYCDAWSCSCSCMGSMSVSSCRCCMVVHPVAVLNAAFCMTCSLLMLVKDARGDHIEGLQMTQLTSGGAVTADSSCCANCVEPPRPQHVGPIYHFLGMPAMRTRWMVGAAAHKIG